jgi:hypothetical protein
LSVLNLWEGGRGERGRGRGEGKGGKKGGGEGRGKGRGKEGRRGRGDKEREGREKGRKKGIANSYNPSNYKKGNFTPKTDWQQSTFAETIHKDKFLLKFANNSNFLLPISQNYDQAII